MQTHDVYSRPYNCTITGSEDLHRFGRVGPAKMGEAETTNVVRMKGSGVSLWAFQQSGNNGSRRHPDCVTRFCFILANNIAWIESIVDYHRASLGQHRKLLRPRQGRSVLHTDSGQALVCSSAASESEAHHGDLSVRRRNCLRCRCRPTVLSISSANDLTAARSSGANVPSGPS